jgi:hypothetical protein
VSAPQSHGRRQYGGLTCVSFFSFAFLCVYWEDN